MQKRGIHPTGVLGSVGAAAVTSAMLGFDETIVGNALGAAATSGSGLVASFGTDSKPFHAGKAAMEGILAADLAAAGFTAATHLFEQERGMIDALVQDRNVDVPDLDFANWELLDNGYKPFACCRANLCSDSGSAFANEGRWRQEGETHRGESSRNRAVHRRQARPKTPLECKFSVPFCIAMGLRGYRGVASDFNEDTLRGSDGAGNRADCGDAGGGGPAAA